MLWNTQGMRGWLVTECVGIEALCILNGQYRYLSPTIGWFLLWDPSVLILLQLLLLYPWIHSLLFSVGLCTISWKADFHKPLSVFPVLWLLVVCNKHWLIIRGWRKKRLRYVFCLTFHDKQHDSGSPVLLCGYHSMILVRFLWVQLLPPLMVSLSLQA